MAQPSIAVGSGYYQYPKKKTTKPPAQAVPTSGFWQGYYEEPDLPSVGDYAPIPTVPQYIAEATGPGGYAEDPAARSQRLFKAELGADPMWQRALDQYKNALGIGRNNLRDAIQQAVIRSGFGDIKGRLTGGLADYADDLDQTTIDAANTNQTSARAVLEQDYNRRLNLLPYQLAARGQRMSGTATTAATALEENQQRTLENTRNDLLDALRGNVTGFGTLQSQLGAELETNLGNVATRLGQAPGSDYSGDTTVDDGSDALVNALGASSSGQINMGGQMLDASGVLQSLLKRGISINAWIRDNPNKARAVGLR